MDNLLGESFGLQARIYDVIRPRPNPAVIDEILTYSGISNGAYILDVGCGTGLSTAPFVQLGYCTTALDKSNEMITIARAKLNQFPNLTFIDRSFEEAELPEQHFDLVVSGSAFQWTDPTVSYRKAHSLLKEQGTLALFWYFFDFDKSPLELGLQELFVEHCPRFPKDASIVRYVERLQAHLAFSELRQREYRRTITYDHDSFISLMRTISWVSTLDNISRTTFFMDLGLLLEQHPEAVQLHITDHLLMAKR